MYCSCGVVCNPLQKCTVLNRIIVDTDCEVRYYVIRHGKNARRGVASCEQRVSCELELRVASGVSQGA